MKLGYVLKPVYFVELLWLEKLKKGGKNEDLKKCLLSGITQPPLLFSLICYKLWNLNIKIKDYSHSSLHEIRLILF